MIKSELWELCKEYAKQYGISAQCVKKHFMKVKDMPSEQVGKALENALKKAAQYGKTKADGLSICTEGILMALYPNRIKFCDYSKKYDAGFAENAFEYRKAAVSVFAENLPLAITWEDHLLLSAIYSQMGNEKMTVGTIYESIYGSGKWRNMENSKRGLFLKKLNGLLKKNSRWAGTYLAGKDKIKFDGDFFVRGILYNAADNSLKVSSKLYEIAKKSKHFAKIPDEMMACKAHDENRIAMAYLAYRVVLAGNAKNSMKPVIKIETLTQHNNGKEVSRKFLHSYFDYLTEKGYITNPVFTQSAISWQVPTIETAGNPLQCVVMHDIDGKTVNVADVPETVAECAKRLNSWNRYIDGIKIYSADGKKLNATLKAVYCRNDWNCGGRFYTGAGGYQALSQEQRHGIKINGSEVVEMDFSSYHPHLLYALAGKQLDADPYGFAERPLAKKVLNIAINAGTPDKAVYAVMHHCGLEEEAAREVLRKAWYSHKALQKYICTGYGVKLQNLDAKIALDIITEMQARKIPCLPVHDSFIVARKHSTELLAVMQAAYEKATGGFTCEICAK